MVITEVLERLRELQDVLAQKNIVQEAIYDAPKHLGDLEELLSRMKKSYIAKNEQYEKMRQNIVDLKKQLFETELAREKSEKAMDTITTQREYEALDKEIREASEREIIIRKDLLKEERSYQELDEVLKSEESLIKDQEVELNERKETIDAEIEEKNKELKILLQEEEKLSEGIDKETKFNLERIIKNKQGIGIVAINKNVCNGCHMILPAQFANEVRMGDKIVYCPYCSRILYYSDEIDSESDFFDEDDAGSLADLEDFFDDEDDDDDINIDDDDDDDDEEDDDEVDDEED